MSFQRQRREIILVESTATVHFYFALSALAQFVDLNLGRCPRLLHFAPLALRAFSLPLQLPVLYCLDRITGYFLTAFKTESLIKLHRCLSR